MWWNIVNNQIIYEVYIGIVGIVLRIQLFSINGSGLDLIQPNARGKKAEKKRNEKKKNFSAPHNFIPTKNQKLPKIAFHLQQPFQVYYHNQSSWVT